MSADTITYQEVAQYQQPEQPAPTAQAPSSSGGQGLNGDYSKWATLWMELVEKNPIYSSDTIEIQSPPPDGLNMNPADCFGVSSDPAVAEQQLLDLMEWTRETGFDKRNCAIIWVCAMIGFNIRLIQWNNEGLGNDPAVLTIEETLANLTTVQGTGPDGKPESLSDMIVQNIAGMILYGAYDRNGGNLAEANATVVRCLNTANKAYESAYNQGLIVNPMLTSLDDSINDLLANYDAWESEYVVNGQLVNSDLPFSEQCVFLTNDVSTWCASCNLIDVESESRTDWVDNMVAAGYPPIYIIFYILGAIIDQYTIDAASVQAELDFYSNVTETYAEMQGDAANENLTQEEYDQMYSDAYQIQTLCEIDPRLAGVPAVNEGAEFITAYGSDGYDDWMNDFYATPDPNGTDPAGAQQAENQQEMTNVVGGGMSALTSFSNNLSTQMQQYEQMINQTAQVDQNCSKTYSTTINDIVSRTGN